MQEAQRFLRYVVPGLIFFIELLIYLLLSGDICFRQLIEQVNPIGIAISGFLASGGLGFLFGTIYYTIVWRERILIKMLFGADLRHILQVAEDKGWLKLSCCGKEVGTTKLSKRGAWRVVISYLNMRTRTSKQIEGAIPEIDRLSNLMNGLGTTCLASLGALFIFLIYDFFWIKSEFSFQAAWAWGFGILFLIVHHLNYKGVIRDYENVCGSILLNEFECEYHDKNIQRSPVKLCVFQSDLKKVCLRAKTNE